eukprot:2744671-Ditylum_brightwellii.AAC.1
MIVPEMLSEYYCLIAREKFLQLALNVANGLCPFLIYHLAESDCQRETYIITKWLGRQELAQTRKRGLIWDTERLCARLSASSTPSSQVENGFDWLKFSRDVLDQVLGQLEIDVEHANVKDIDD